MPSAKVVVYGEIGIDNLISIPQPLDYERDAIVTADEYMIGGYGCNIAILLALWGVPVRLSGYAIGDDPYGAMILAMLSRYPALDRSFIETRPAIKTAFCRVIVDPSGSRAIMAFNLHERCADPSPLSPELLDGATHIVLDSLSQRGAFLPAAEIAHRAGLTVINSDINTLACPLLPFVDVICNSAGLLRNKDGVTDAPAFARQLHQKHGAAVITTDGPRPIQAIASDGHEFWVTPPRIPAAQIIDTTGAGDALKSGVTYGLVRGWPLEQCVRYGAAAGALIIQSVGAVAREPSTEEVLQLVQSTEVRDDPSK
jgi:ribokinase